MASLIILGFYSLIILMYVLASFFVVYHLVKYSLNSELNTVMLIFFVVVSAGLLFSNLLLFFSIDWNTMLSKLIS